MGSLSSEAEEERETQREKMCVRFTLIIANCLLALLGLLLLAGGVWRIVDDGSLREVAKEIRDTQEWDEVKKGVDGLEEAVKEAASHKYFNYALLAMGGVTLLVALFGFCGAKKESQCLLTLYCICIGSQEGTSGNTIKIIVFWGISWSFEHVQHSTRDDESTENVNKGDKGRRGCQSFYSIGGIVASAHEHEATNSRNTRDSVGHRHQWGM